MSISVKSCYQAEQELRKSKTALIISEIIKIRQTYDKITICHHSTIGPGKIEPPIELANAASNLTFSYSPYRLTENDFCKVINTDIKNEWNNLWITKSQESYLRKIKSNVHEPNSALNLPQKEQVIINRLLIPHSQIID